MTAACAVGCPSGTAGADLVVRGCWLAYCRVLMLRPDGAEASLLGPRHDLPGSSLGRSPLWAEHLAGAQKQACEGLTGRTRAEHDC